MKSVLSNTGHYVWSIDVSGSLSESDLSTFTAAVEALPSSARCLVLVGDKQIFNSGASRSALSNMQSAMAECGANFVRALLRIPVPTVAAFAGHAIGGGLLLGLWCDEFVFAKDRLYGTNFTALGFTPGMGATVALEDAFGAPLAREMLYSGGLLTGTELQARAVAVPYIVDRSEVETRAFSLARDCSFADSTSVRLLRGAIASRRRVRLESALRDEAEMHREIFSRPETHDHISEHLPPT